MVEFYKLQNIAGLHATARATAAENGQSDIVMMLDMIRDQTTALLLEAGLTSDQVAELRG